MFLISLSAKASFILLPMDENTQQNHLKAYGITYWCLSKDYKASWLLNYRGGSFLLPYVSFFKPKKPTRLKKRPYRKKKPLKSMILKAFWFEK